MVKLKRYKYITHFLFLTLFCLKLINVIQARIQIEMYIFWILPLLIFYFYVNKLWIRAYQWFCFILIIYFLSASVRVFGTSSYWIDIAEVVLLISLFIHIMFGPKMINKAN